MRECLEPAIEPDASMVRVAKCLAIHRAIAPPKRCAEVW